MAKNTIHTHTSFQPITSLLRRFHLMLFFIFIVSCLVVATLLLNSMLSKKSVEDGYTSSINAGSIDSVTLERVKALHTSSETYPAPTLPEGRINPLGE